MVNAKKIACSARAFAKVPINIIKVNVPQAIKYQPTKAALIPSAKKILNSANEIQNAP